MRIITLLARHGTAQYGDAVEAIEEWFSKYIPCAERELLVADNALPERLEESLGSGRTLIGASNAHWEFSAWDRAISHLGARIEQHDFVHLATSAFRRLDPHHLDRFDADLLGLIRGRAAALGHIDCYDAPVIISDRSLRC